MRTELTKQQRQKIAEMYAKGEKLEYIAALFKISTGYVSILGVRAGYPRRQTRREGVRGSLSQKS